MPRIKKDKLTREEIDRLVACGYEICNPIAGWCDSHAEGRSTGFLVVKHKSSDLVIFKRDDGYAGAFGNGLWEIPNDYSGLKLTT